MGMMRWRQRRRGGGGDRKRRGRRKTEKKRKRWSNMELERRKGKMMTRGRKKMMPYNPGEKREKGTQCTLLPEIRID